jgi:ABC-2 type transport system permease protein
MVEILHILRFKTRSVVMRSTELNPANIVKGVGSLIVFGGFMIGAYYSSRIATDYLLDTARLGLFLLHRFLSMLLFVFFLSINVGNIIVSYATFYRSPEMEYYLTKPISHTNLFLIKFLDNFFYSSTVFFLLALAVLYGYGSHFHMAWTFYFKTMVFMLLPFMLLAGCSAVIMLMLLMRFAGVLGVRKVIVLLVALYLGSLSGYFSVTNPVKLQAAVMEHYPHVDEYFGYLDAPAVKFLPNHWIAESLYWTMRGDSSYALSYTTILIFATIALFGLMVYTARRLFYDSWLSSLQLRSAGGESPKMLMRMFSLTKPGRFDSQSTVLFRKEFWQFFREPSQWIHLAIISALVLTFIASIVQINLRQTLPFLQTVSYMVVLVFNLFLVSSIALRFVYPSMSTEGMNFWKILSAPVRREKVFWLKFILYIVPIILTSEALVIFSHRSLREFPVLLQLSMYIMLFASAALTALNLGAGSFFSNFREKNPIRVASSQAATLTFLICIVYLTFVIASVFVPFNDYFAFKLRSVPFDPATMTVATLLVFLISGLICAASLVVGLRALKRDF